MWSVSVAFSVFGQCVCKCESFLFCASPKPSLRNLVTYLGTNIKSIALLHFLTKHLHLSTTAREAPTIDIFPNEPQTISVGQVAYITCRASGEPEPIITWARRDSRPLGAGIRNDGQGVITFETVTADDAGEYECHARNAAGSVSATSVLNVQQLPEIAIVPDVEDLRLTVGDELRLDCSAIGVPAPQVVWYDNQQTRTEIENLPWPRAANSRALLNKYKVREEDEGTYMCVAKNSAGTELKYVHLIVEPKRGDVGEYRLVAARPEGGRAKGNGN